MRKRFLTLLGTTAIITLSSIGSAHALVVSDPGSYARAAQRLQELKKQLETAKENLDQVTSVKERLEGNLNIGRDMIGDITRAREDVSDLTGTIQEIPGLLDGNFDMSNLDDIRDVMDKLYSEGDSTLASVGATTKERRKHRQRAIKSTLENSTKTISSMEEDMSEVNELAQQIDQTENIKEAQDLTNRLLAEILHMQQKSVMLLAQHYRAESLAKYKGADTKQPSKDSEDKRKVDNRSPLQRAKEDGSLDDELEELSVDEVPEDCAFGFGSGC